MANILVVDDETSITTLLKEALGLFGHEVTVFNFPLKALPRATSGDYDLVILDLAMPRLDGFGFLLDLRSSGPAATKVLVFSGYVSDEERLQLLDLGADKVMRKPAPIGEIVDAVKELVGDESP